MVECDYLINTLNIDCFCIQECFHACVSGCGYKVSFLLNELSIWF